MGANGSVQGVVSSLVVVVQQPERSQGTSQQASGSDRTERLSGISAGPNGTITAAQAAVERWLGDMGLHLNPTKTRITHTLDPYEGAVGLDFLGFTLRQYRVGRTRAGRLKGKVSTGFMVRLTPSKDAVKRHSAELNATVRRLRASTQEALIAALNAQIRAWCPYDRHVLMIVVPLDRPHDRPSIPYQPHA